GAGQGATGPSGDGLGRGGNREVASGRDDPGAGTPRRPPAPEPPVLAVPHEQRTVPGDRTSAARAPAHGRRLPGREAGEDRGWPPGLPAAHGGGRPAVRRAPLRAPRWPLSKADPQPPAAQATAHRPPPPLAHA